MKLFKIDCNKNLLFLCVVKIENEYNNEIINEYFNIDEINEIKNKAIKKKMEYISSRIASKIAIANLINKYNYKEISIQRGVFFQPIVKVDSKSNVQISISHNDKYAIALAFNEKYPCGVDIEQINESNRIVIKRILTDREIHDLNKINMQEKEKLTMLWTIKEAISKVLRTGMNCDFKLYETDSIKKINNAYNGVFKNFNQYMFTSVILDEQVLTIVYPKDKLNFIKILDSKDVTINTNS